jgi:hypothetical protein
MKRIGIMISGDNKGIIIDLTYKGYGRKIKMAQNGVIGIEVNMGGILLYPDDFLHNIDIEYIFQIDKANLLEDKKYKYKEK